jgi:hypothetical protein
MEDGISWGDLWLRDGEVYIDGTDSVWEEGTQGWTAYYIEEDDGSPLSGDFELTLFINDVPVQSGSFTVEPPGTRVSIDLHLGAGFVVQESRYSEPALP